MKSVPNPFDVVQMFAFHYHSGKGRARVSFSSELVTKLLKWFDLDWTSNWNKRECRVLLIPTDDGVSEQNILDWIGHFNHFATTQNIPIEAEMLDDGLSWDITFRWTEIWKSSEEEVRPFHSGK